MSYSSLGSGVQLNDSFRVEDSRGNPFRQSHSSGKMDIDAFIERGEARTVAFAEATEAPNMRSARWDFAANWTTPSYGNGSLQ